MSDIEKEIKERQEEGDDLFYPAKVIALKLGKDWPKKHGSVRIYKDQILEIHFDTYVPNLSVNNSDERVLTFHQGDIRLYRRGAWVHYLKKLAKPLIAQIKKKEQEEADRRQKERLYRWGLD